MSDLRALASPFLAANVSLRSRDLAPSTVADPYSTETFTFALPALLGESLTAVIDLL
jgi:hypothetical protein